MVEKSQPESSNQNLDKEALEKIIETEREKQMQLEMQLDTLQGYIQQAKDLDEQEKTIK